MQNTPMMVEVIGPAGAGKTSLIKTFTQVNNGIIRDTKPSLWSIRNLPYLVRNILSLLPIFLREPLNSLKLTSREFYCLIYLNGWYNNLCHHTPGNCLLNLMDHGPIYMLTSLLDFGPKLTKSKHFKKWWERTFKHWSSILDVIIWLDAPNSILAQRINSRYTWHIVREKPEEEMFDFLIRYRNSLEKVISMSKSRNDELIVFNFDTEHDTTELMINKIVHDCGMNFKEDKR